MLIYVIVLTSEHMLGNKFLNLLDYLASCSKPYSYFITHLLGLLLVFIQLIRIPPCHYILCLRYSKNNWMSFIMCFIKQYFFIEIWLVRSKLSNNCGIIV